MESEMEKSEVPPVVFAGERKSEYSPIGLLIAFLLGIALIVFLQFLIRDVTEALRGPRPEMPVSVVQSGSGGYQYGGIYYDSYQEAREVFEKTELLPYETQAILVSTFINGPFFVLAIILVFGLGKVKSAYKLAATTYFVAMVFNMFVLLVQLASHIYKINQKLATYGISLFLIVVFTVSIIYVQDKFRAKTKEVSV